MNFKELNKVTVFDPDPMMSTDDIFPKIIIIIIIRFVKRQNVKRLPWRRWLEVAIIARLIVVKGIGRHPCKKTLRTAQHL